jgi:hypothetical protein
MFATTHKLSMVATIVTVLAFCVLQVAGGTPLAMSVSQPGVADLDW